MPYNASELASSSRSTLPSLHRQLDGAANCEDRHDFISTEDAIILLSHLFSFIVDHAIRLKPAEPDPSKRFMGKGLQSNARKGIIENLRIRLLGSLHIGLWSCWIGPFEEVPSQDRL